MLKHAMAPQNKHKKKSTLFSVLNIVTFSASWCNFFITSLQRVQRVVHLAWERGLSNSPLLPRALPAWQEPLLATRGRRWEPDDPRGQCYSGEKNLSWTHKCRLPCEGLLDRCSTHGPQVWPSDMWGEVRGHSHDLGRALSPLDLGFSCLPQLEQGIWWVPLPPSSMHQWFQALPGTISYCGRWGEPAHPRLFCSV